ncbi:MAG: hypothetical protein IJX96_05145 [Clostridia bacterium]|nr:hypothetical protein [Clostridia bacterium]
MTVDKRRRAQEVFQLLCRTLDNRSWKYTKNENNLSVSLSVVGNDLPMRMNIFVEAERELVSAYTGQDFSVSEEKCVPFCMGVCAINNHLIDGSFDFDVLKRTVIYRLIVSYHDATVGTEIFDYLIDCSTATVDDVNHTMKAYVDGQINYDEYIEKMQA